MMARYILPIVLAMLTFLSVPALANEPITCGGKITAAEQKHRDWAIIGAKGFRIIDGDTLKTMDQLRDALIAAKQNIPVVIGGNFAGWDFHDQIFGLSGVCFKGSDLSGSNWRGVNAFGIGFIKANLEGAIFDNAGLEYVLLREPDLKGAKMRAANLSHGRLDGGWDGVIEDWDLTGANMTDFRFDCGIMVDDGCTVDRSGTKFTGAILTGADISSLPFWGQADYYGAVFNATTISPSQLTDLKGADFRGNMILKGGDRTVNLTPAEMTTLVQQASAAEALMRRPSFDCARASSKVEKWICSDVEMDLRQLDRQMASVYSYVRPKNPAAGAEQKAWLAERAKCKDAVCVSDAYFRRIDQLIVQLGAVDLLQPGQSALYIGDDVPFPASFIDSPLYIRITPVLVGSSMSTAVLLRGANGSYTIWGSAIGGNAHICAMSADGLRFDGKSGWFSIEGAPVFRMAGDRMEIISNGHPDRDGLSDSGNYVTCGMRAMFGPMKAIKVDAKLLKAETDILARMVE